MYSNRLHHLRTPAKSADVARREIEVLLDELRAGNDQEQNQRWLFRRYYRLVCHFFHQRGRMPEEVEDLSQETFLRVFRGLDGFRGESRFESWLLSIADNVHRETWRKAATAKRASDETSLEEVTETAEEGIRDRDAIPLRRLLGKEQVRAVTAAIDQLPAQMGHCVMLRFTQELSYREIAEVLQISVDAVKVQLHRGRHRLRQILAGHFDEIPKEGYGLGG